LRIHKTKIEGPLIIEPDVFKDERGFFMESWSKKKFTDIGLDVDFLQDNHSRSIGNVVRGLHFQTFPGQAKLVRCVRGKIWDVAVDIRKDSPTIGKWAGVELSEENKRMFFIPVGFAHGFATLDDLNDVLYKCSSLYDPKTESGIAWNDPDIGVDWKLRNPLLSRRDMENQSFQEYLSSLEG